MRAANPEIVVIARWVFRLFGVFLIFILLKTFLFETFHIPSGSMKPTLQVGDHILVNKLACRFRGVEYRSLYVFKYPLNPRRDYVKRVIGCGGDQIEIVRGRVYRNGELLNEEYVDHQYKGEFGPVEVPEGHLFVLGDNRRNSDDSRFWGFVPRENIVGRAFLIYWPLKRFQLID